MDILEHIPTDLNNQIYSYLGKHPIAELFRRETTIEQDYDLGCFGYMLESSEDYGDDISNNYLYDIDEISKYILLSKRIRIREKRPSFKFCFWTIRPVIRYYKYCINSGKIERNIPFYKHVLLGVRNRQIESDDDIDNY